MAKTYLTIDDAPTERLPEKVETLAARDIPAVFFCEGRRLDGHDSAAREAIERGYHLGNHTDTHLHASEIPPERFRAEVTRTESSIEELYEATGETRPARLFRFPYGDKDGAQRERLQRILREQGFAPPEPAAIDSEWYECHAGDMDWPWTVDIEDWIVETPAEMRAQVADAEGRLHDSSTDIVLFHDGGNDPELFDAFVDGLAEYDLTFGDPLTLVR